jgi:hypothetical protein
MEKNYAGHLRLVLCNPLADYPDLIATYLSHGPIRVLHAVLKPDTSPRLEASTIVGAIKVYCKIFLEAILIFFLYKILKGVSTNYFFIS